MTYTNTPPPSSWDIDDGYHQDGYGHLRNGRDDLEPPEEILLGGRAWVVAILLAIIHTGLTSAMQLIDPASLKEFAEQAATPDTTEAMRDSVIVMAVVLMGVFQVLLLLCLFFVLRSVKRAGKKCRLSRLILTYFAICFCIPAAVAISGSDQVMVVPTWLVAADGIVQILAAVAAVVGAVFFYREPVREYFDELCPPPADKFKG